MSGMRHTEHTTTYNQGGLTGGAHTGEPMGDKIQRKAQEVMHSAKEAMPGTAEHKATHGTGGFGTTAGTHGVGTSGFGTTAGTHGVGTGMGTGMGTGYGATGMSDTGYTAGPAAGLHGTGAHGTGEPMGQKIQRKAGEVWEGVKEAMPGTAEHKVTHGTGTGTGTMTGATHEYHHTSRTNI